MEQLGPYTLRQSEACFPLGQDTLCLGAFATVRRQDRVCDLGCGSGALLLLAAARAPLLSLTGIELEPGAAALARANLAANGLEGEIITGDLRQACRGLASGGFDLVVSNPPYFAVDTGGNGGQARMEDACPLDGLCGAAGRLLKSRGRFALVHRPERLADLLAALRGNGLEPKRMQLIHHRLGKPPSAVLVEAVRQARPGLQILAPHFIQA